MPSPTTSEPGAASNSAQQLLADSEFDEATFIGGDFTHADLRHKTFADCEFRELSAQEADFQHGSFENCRFVGCDLTMARFGDARLLDVEFIDCKLMGVDWSQVGGLVFEAGFERCVLTHCSFIGLTMKKARIQECKADEANFAGTNLEGADFARTNLRGAKFSDTNLTGADLSLAVNYDVNPSDNRLRKTRFSVAAALRVAERMGIVIPDK
ncbi:MAG: pentapeptide repeat-containing protein [Myxococcota bacterium]